MKALPLALALLLLPTPARAGVEAPRPETDHEDAYDDGGPRSFALLLDPGGVALGAYGVEGDFLLGDAAAVSLQGELFPVAGSTAYGVTLGMPLFPQRVPFHGFVIHPRLAFAHASSVDVGGAGATLGWQWTLRVGFTVRLGGGLMVQHALGGESSAQDAVASFRPVLDGSLGWVF